jgi:hypothetical protein
MTHLWLFSSHRIQLEMSKQFAIGDEKIFFESIASVCEDQEGNFFVLDRKAARVYKFSKEGKCIVCFGNKGQGPGEFIDPHHIFITGDRKIVVNEIRDFIHFFDQSGKFLERKRVNIGLGICYLNDNLFYGWHWIPEGKQQLTFCPDGKIIEKFFTVSRDTFSVNVPDETGRLVMCNFYTEEYTPYFLFSQYESYFAVGISNQYEILVIDHSNNKSEKISRKIKPDKIIKKERGKFVRLINENTRLPDIAKKKFLKKIPGYKNHLSGIHITGSHVWAFRIREDILAEDSPIPVDLFTITGDFKGTIRLKKIPLYISSKNIYFTETNNQEDLILARYQYTLTPINYKHICKLKTATVPD